MLNFMVKSTMCPYSKQPTLRLLPFIGRKIIRIKYSQSKGFFRPLLLQSKSTGGMSCKASQLKLLNVMPTYWLQQRAGHSLLLIISRTY